MRTLSRLLLFTLVGLALGITGVSADDKSEYDRRNAERFRSLFAWLDRDGDRAVTLSEAYGDLNFSPVFNDMDINRDGVVTADELNRYVEQRYGRR
jgi:hypothetical protein